PQLSGGRTRGAGRAGRSLKTDLRLPGIGERFLPLLALIPNDEPRAMRPAELARGGDPTGMGRDEDAQECCPPGHRHPLTGRAGTAASRHRTGPPTVVAARLPVAAARSTGRRTGVDSTGTPAPRRGAA